LRQACLSALQQILKEYLNEYIRERGLWPEAQKRISSLKKGHVKGWLRQYKIVFQELLGCNWERSPVPLSHFEEIVLARNVIEHEGHITLLEKRRDPQYRSKYPVSLYSDEMFPELVGVTEESLRKAMGMVNEFVTWLENNG
jgi:hypothetical protein